MKYGIIFLLVSLFSIHFVWANTGLPQFLEGSWKMENKEVFERWDVLSEESMKGFSWKMEEGQMIVTEYLDISRRNGKLIYTATVVDQNEGKGVEFVLKSAGETYIFENPDHDFPKRISYQKLSDSEIWVEVTDGDQRNISYKLIKHLLREPEEEISNPNFDPELAEKLGGDKYGMKNYFLVILKTGSNQTSDRELISRAFKGHMENINRLVEIDKLIVAGPLGKNDNQYRGIFILSAESETEAEELLQTDPAIEAGILEADIYNWYGSAALSEYLDAADKIWKSKP